MIWNDDEILLKNNYIFKEYNGSIDVRLNFIFIIAMLIKSLLILYIYYKL